LGHEASHAIESRAGPAGRLDQPASIRDLSCCSSAFGRRRRVVVGCGAGGRAADSTPEAVQGADPRQLCLGPASTSDERVKGCSAVIESGQVQGGLLAAAYAQRGFVFTLKRNLEQAQKDLD